MAERQDRFGVGIRRPALTNRQSSFDAMGAGQGADIELGTRRHRTVASRGSIDVEEEGLLAGSDAEADPSRSRGREGFHNDGGGGNGRDGGAASKPGSSSKTKGPLSTWLDSLSPRLKFGILVSSVMLFFGLHNVLQEALFAMEGFHFGWSLGMLEAVGVLAGSMLERVHSGTTSVRVAPYRYYLVLAGLLGISSSLSNIALNYIQYPTKVVFRSCKLIPTMMIAVVWRKKIVSRWEFMAASAVCAGLIIFAQADAELEPDFDPRGIAMVMLSVCADAFLPNMQEYVFGMGASRVEVTFHTNSLTVVGMLLSTALNGNLFEFLSYAVTSRSVAMHMVAYALFAHVAISSHMMVLKEYGGVTAVLVGNTRKTMTIALSFVLFPKPFSFNFVLGGGLVLGGLAANVMIKERRKEAEAALKSRTILSDLVSDDLHNRNGNSNDNGYGSDEGLSRDLTGASGSSRSGVKGGDETSPARNGRAEHQRHARQSRENSSNASEALLHGAAR